MVKIVNTPIGEFPDNCSRLVVLSSIVFGVTQELVYVIIVQDGDINLYRLIFWNSGSIEMHKCIDIHSLDGCKKNHNVCIHEDVMGYISSRSSKK